MRALLLLLTTAMSVVAYMNEPYPPFIVTSPLPGQQIKRGDTVNVTWELSPGVRFPLYGYAASRTARTVAGLLPPNAERNERYTQNIETHLQFTDYWYEWTVDGSVAPGAYQLGIGFYYHEVSPAFHILP